MMTGFEYKVLPAPMRGLKGKGIKGTPARFANALQSVMNEQGALGWEYQRTDTLPVEERVGLTGKTTTFQNMLVFRRALAIAVEEAPVVAALIEDQTDVLDDENLPAAVPEAVIVEAPKQIEDTPAEDIAEHAEDIAEHVAALPEAELSSDARDRVSDTLKEPFAFPWNKRGTGKTTRAQSHDTPDHPAE